jgi:hypothetical protein
LIKKILENLGMKKPAKPASKKAAPSPSKNTKKAAPAKPVAKKAAPAKHAAKAPAKAVAKKPAPKHAPAKPVKKVVKAAAKPASKAPAKNIAKKIQEKIAATKKAKDIKAAKKEIAVKKGLAKKAPAPMKAAPKASAKVDPKTTKKAEAPKATSKKEAVKAAPAKVETKSTKKAEAEKPAKKLTKKEEKELLKAKGKKGALSFEEEQEAESSSKSRGDDEDEDDDLEGAAPKKVKMVFDEDIEEEIVPVRKKSKSGLDDDIKENLAEEILALAEDFSIDEVFGAIRNMDLFKVESDECVVRGCDNPATTSGYCRYHYIKLWKDVKKKEAILSEGRLAKIIEELVRKYPMKYIETIIHDLADDKAFNHVLKDLDIETDEAEIDAFDDDELLDDDQDIAFETKVVKPSFDD